MLALGTKLGPYEIVAPLGAGGMGEVYRARDTKLGRDVALKVLPEAFAAYAERMARFEREAKVLASLNHPNIATIHGLEESDAIRALVMELVEGPTLAERISGVVGAGLKPAPTSAKEVPLDEALPIARQICEGLEYAHERGIVHRDLKPANVKITPDGVVKLLDFGLAKALEGEAASVNTSTSPTLSHLATQAGIILGTAAYMAPEQAKGKPVDRRADIWAFGCVLYEMLAGKPAFEGETVTDVLAAVVRAEPDWAALAAETPRRARELLERCLTKDPRQRLRDIGEARIAIERCEQNPVGEAASASVAAAERDSRSERLAWAALLLVLVAGVSVGLGYFRRAPAGAAAQPIQSALLPPPGSHFVGLWGNMALSPDGGKLAFAAIDGKGLRSLWVRSLGSMAAQPPAGTEGAYFPFWSPDSTSIGFFDYNKIERVDASGGPVVVLADGGAFRGASWGPDGRIIFCNGAGMYEVGGSGGPVTTLLDFALGTGPSHAMKPFFLPDGRHLLVHATALSSSQAGPHVLARSGVYVFDLATKQLKFLTAADSDGEYASGYLLYVVQGNLMAQPFDLVSLELSGSPVALAQQVGLNPTLSLGAFTLGGNGLLAYGAEESGSSQLNW